jgi:hypothetical protein
MMKVRRGPHHLLPLVQNLPFLLLFMPTIPSLATHFLMILAYWLVIPLLAHCWLGMDKEEELEAAEALGLPIRIQYGMHLLTYNPLVHYLQLLLNCIRY